MVALRGLLTAGVVALCSLQGEASELRGMITAKLAVSSCKPDPAAPPQTLANAPASFIADPAHQPCPSGMLAIYVNQAGQWVKFCGKTCVVTETINADAEVGGQDCSGNRQVTVTLSGAEILTGLSKTMQPQYTCVPFGDKEPLQVVAADGVNMAGCALADKVFGSMVCKFRMAGSNVVKLGNAAANAMKSTGKKWVNQAGQKVDAAGKALGNAGEEIKDFFTGR